MAKQKKPARPKARLPKGLRDIGARRDPRYGPDAGRHPRRLRVLRLRAAGDARLRIHRRARQVPAGSGQAERGRLLLRGRGRAVAVAALRPDGAAGPLRRSQLRRPAETVPALSDGARLAQREAGAGPLPRVHPVRRRHGGRRGRGGRCRALHACRRLPGDHRHSPRRLRHPCQQPQAARRGAGADRRGSGRSGPCGPAPHGAARGRQARPARDRGRAAAAGRGPQGRVRRFHARRRPGAAADRHGAGLRRRR